MLGTFRLGWPGRGPPCPPMRARVLFEASCSIRALLRPIAFVSLSSCIDPRSTSRCLKSLTRRVCPMCRNPFQPSEVTKIHLDQRARSPSVTSSPKVASPSPSDPGTRLARELHDRINSFVQTGASTSVAHTLTEDCKTFFQENASTDVRNHPGSEVLQC